MKGRIRECFNEHDNGIKMGVKVYLEYIKTSINNAIKFKNIAYWIRTIIFLLSETILFGLSCTMELMILPFDLLYYITKKY